MSEEKREAAKRRLMFVPGEDFYFLTYTLLAIVDDLACTNERPFSEPMKVAYLADFIGGDSDMGLITSSSQLSRQSHSRLALLYDRAIARRAPTERLIAALSKRGLIAEQREPGKPTSVYITNPESTAALLRNALFDGERKRIRELRRVVPKLRTMTLTTLKTRLFDDNQVRTWGE